MIRRSLILDTTVRVVFDAALVLSMYLLFAGHNQPGGGFVGGLVAAAAISFRYLAAGTEELMDWLRVPPWSLLALGLFVATATGLVPVVLGRGPLDQAAVEWDVALLGKIKATSATAFDAGVYLVVVGLVLMIFEAVGDDSEEAHDTNEEPNR